MNFKVTPWNFITFLLFCWAMYLHWQVVNVESQVSKCIDREPKKDTIVVQQTPDTIIQWVLPYETYDAP